MERERVRTKSSRVARVRALAVAITFGLVAAGAAFGGLADGYIPQLGVTVPGDKAAPVRRSFPTTASPESLRPAAEPPAAADPIPAHLLGPDVPVPISPQLLRPTNGWVVSDGRVLLAVYAGAAGADPTTGRLVIVRQDLDGGVQTQDVVDVPRAGELTIARAPQGSVLHASVERIRLGVRAAAGVAGTVDVAPGGAVVSLRD